MLVVSSPAEVKAEKESGKPSQELTGVSQCGGRSIVRVQARVANYQQYRGKGNRQKWRSGDKPESLQVEFRNGQDELGWYLESEAE